jgi:hypothetical protein
MKVPFEPAVLMSHARISFAVLIVAGIVAAIAGEWLLVLGAAGGAVATWFRFKSIAARRKPPPSDTAP